MKTIKIQQVTEANKKSILINKKQYLVSLGNKTKNYFTDKKAASAFLVETNIFLNVKLQELNFIFIDAFNFYRVAWFYMDNKNISRKQLDLKQLDKLSSSEINNLLSAFDILVNRSGYANGNYFTFSHFYTIINSLNNLFEILLTLYKSKGHTDKIYKLNHLVNQVKSIKKELEIYPNSQSEMIEKIKELTK